MKWYYILLTLGILFFGGLLRYFRGGSYLNLGVSALAIFLGGILFLKHKPKKEVEIK
jgi:hypothetical protein